MKKVLVTSVLTALMASSAYAMQSPYADAARGDWSYGAIGKLINEQVITGYDASAYDQNKIATRYEMARFLANGISKYDQATVEQKEIINKLSAEYANELKLLGIDYKAGKYVNRDVNVALSKETDKGIPFKVDAETLVDYSHVDSASHEGSDAFSWRQRIHLNWDINDTMSYHARLQSANKFGSGEGNANFKLTRNYIRVKGLGGIDRIQLGRQNLAEGRYLALAIQGNADGIVASHSFDKVKVDAFAVDMAKDGELIGVSANYIPDNKKEFNAMYFKADASTANGGVKEANYWGIGTSIELDKGLNLVGEYVKSDSDGHPDAWAAQVTYNWKSGKRQKGLYTYEGMVNNKVAHDQAIGISYRDIEKNGLPGNYGNFYPFGDISKSYDGQKGWMIGYQNMLLKGLRLSLQFQALEKQNGHSDQKYYTAFDWYY